MRRCAGSVLKYSTDPIQEGRATIDHADYTASTRQLEIDHTDHTDHTDQGSICLAWQV